MSCGRGCGCAAGNEPQAHRCACDQGACRCAGPSTGPSCGLTLCGGLPAVGRIVLGGLLILAGYLKLTNPDFSYTSVKGFQLGLGEPVLQVLAYAVPWSELLCGILLLLGLWARGAAVVVIVMMLGFMGGIVSVMIRGLDVRCGCFGALKLFCGDAPMGWCHLIRNAVMAGVSLLVLWAGPGLLALDNLLVRKARE